MSKGKQLFKRYFIDAMGAMAQGLFASLLIGTIIGTVGDQFGIKVLSDIASYAKSTAVVGAAMAVAIGYALKADPLVMFSLVTVGAAANALGSAGGPLAVLIIAIIASECGSLVSKKTKVDILVTPFVTITVGVILSILIAPPVGKAARAVGDLIMWATDLHPFFMGILVSLIIGLALTLPSSSAAICAAFHLTGLAGGAAVAGCCAQMVGFAVMSFRENRWSGLVSQGLGTSMLQIGNIARKPIIWLAPTLSAAILGPVSTVLLKMTNSPAGAGMGTAGLVGPLGCWDSMSTTMDSSVLLAEIIGLYFVAPAILSLIFHSIMVRLGWVKAGDMKLKKC